MAAPYNPPKKNEDFEIQIALEDYDNPGNFQRVPTIAAGDFKIRMTGSSPQMTNLTTLPAVSPATGYLVTIALSASEMNQDVVTVIGIDQTSPKEWSDIMLCIPTTQ